MAAIPLFRHTELLHTLVKMGSAALAVAFVLPRYVIKIFRKGLMKYTPHPTRERERDRERERERETERDRERRRETE